MAISPLYSSLNGSYNAAADMASVASGSTDTTSTVSTKKTVQRSNFLDNHLKSIGKTTTSTTTAAGKSFLDKHLSLPRRRKWRRNKKCSEIMTTGRPVPK